MADKRVFELLREETNLPIEVIKSDTNATRIERLLENTRTALSNPKLAIEDKEFLLGEERKLRDTYLKAQVRAIKTRRQLLRDTLLSGAKLTKEEAVGASTKPGKTFPITSKEFGKKLIKLRSILLKKGHTLGLLEKALGGVQGLNPFVGPMVEAFEKSKEPEL